MKILAIRGCNLASIEGEFEVDFRSEPLRSAGIFAITGNTGAGKTTILDAMCIALYRCSPRLDNIEKGDDAEHKVKVDDIRTILRKGKGKGYAEVDFLSVDGNEYRIRWSVSRAHANPAGNLQDATFDLTNLNTGEHRKLSAKEHKTEIPRLVGLEYKQFTRAVLLAQGNFSAFLKADESEKAKMLETLTDTAIYSRISTKIFAKRKEAEQELELLETKRNTLQLLSDEEITELKEKARRLDEENRENNGKREILRTKLDWISRLADINGQITMAEMLLVEIKEKLATAQPKIERLKLIDSVQQIRDSYTSLRDSKLQSVNYREQLALHTKQLDEKENGYEKAIKAVSDAVAHQEMANGEFLKAQPLITEAAQLEKQHVNDRKLYDDLFGEIKNAEEIKGKNLSEIASCEKHVALLEIEQKEKRTWLEKHAHYSDAIPMIPTIIANIKSIDNEKMSLQLKEKNLTQSRGLLATHEAHLIVARQSEEALKQTMSSEIAALRKRLVSGVPCPVCGSKHHEVVEIAANLLEEKQLEKAKEENRCLIEHLETNISNCRTEIEKLCSAIEMHNNAIDQYNNANLSYLSGIENAKDLLDGRSAVTDLTTLSSNWNNYKERLSVITNDIALYTNKKSGHLSRIEEVSKELEEKNNRLHLLKDGMKERETRHNSILGNWKSADERLKYHNESIANANKRFVEATKYKADIETERNRLKGVILGKQQQLAETDAKITALTEKVNTFLSARNDDMKMEMLEELLNTSHSTITAMRNDIDTLKKSMTAAEATIKERRQVLENHNNAPTKPTEEEDATFIKERLALLEEEQKKINETSTQISVRLLKDEKNREEFEKYNQEYKEKTLQKTHWATLDKVFGSATGEKLMKSAQEYTLDILLNVANTHLAEMTKRYKLERIANNSLGIKVIDLDMMSESRSAHTLSGGETFMVSLALSLALSSLSSNRMKIESLFIDEGFGALDKETLQTALMMLEKLHSHGRKIGVISHLSEMLEQIPVKVNVVRISPGKSKIETITKQTLAI